MPLSWEQEQIWLHGMLVPDLPLYNETVTIRHRGDIGVAGLEKSLEALSSRHEILRTTFEANNGTPYQIVGRTAPVTAESADLSGLPEADREQESARIVSAFATRPFDLACGPLFRALVVRYGSDDTRIYLTLHHLIFDGVSLRRVLLPELIALYQAFLEGVRVELPSPSMQYEAYAASQRRGGASVRESAMAFWRGTLAGHSPLELPSDRPRTPHTTQRGAMHSFSFGEAFSAEVRDAARRERTTTFNLLLASFSLLLARYADTTDVVLGTTYGGRASTELEDVVGCFLNTILLRTDLSGDPSFRELLKRVRNVTLDAMEHADVPFQEVVRELLPRRENGDAPVQVGFAFQPPPPELPADWDLDVFAVSNGGAKFDVHLEVEEKGGVLRGRLLFNTDLFDPETITTLQRHWFAVLTSAIQAPENIIWRLPVLSEEEQQWLRRSALQTQCAVPPRCVHELFGRQAQETPERIALSGGGALLTYGELDRQSMQIAHRLGELGFGKGSVIALLAERSPEMVIALLGIMRSGAAYVPLDPKYPIARLAHMIRASNAGLVLTQRSLASRLPEDGPPALNVSDCLSAGEQDRSARALPEVETSALAYIIFTSGSTGVPKGVEISHSALTNFLWSMRTTPGIGADDVLLAVTSICFDISALELFLPLITGARIELASTEEAADPELLRGRLLSSGATIMQATPASWRMLIESGWTGSRRLTLLCGGEALSENLAGELIGRSALLWNMYGPTETTVWSACGRVTDPSQITLGEPIANTSLYVLDSRQALVPIGVHGELYIGGAGLADGYRGQPELTQERFPTVTFEDGEVCRLYRTGDRVRRLRDGSLLFLGRTDRQIKLHGHRIELGEVEHALSSLPGVQEGVVVTAQHPTRGEFLSGFVIPKPGASLSLEELRAGLEGSLPAYMQPRALQILTEVPLTPNGKLDRNRLPSLAVQDEICEAEEPLPGVEQRLAEIWCDLLRLKVIGRRDNFFDLGGHSLLATRFMAQANRAFGRTFTLASFVQAPTVAQFARIVEGSSTPQTRLTKRGSSPGKQLLWVGAYPWVMEMARHLRGDTTLYTLTPDPASCASPTTGCTIEGMATQLLKHIRELQPEGPYALGGFCLQGLVAYEIAQQLREAGEEIALLVIGDLYAPFPAPRWTTKQTIVRRLRSEVFHLSVMRRSSPATWFGYMRRRFQAFLDLLQRCMRAAESGRPLELQDALQLAGMRYEIAPFPGKVLFLESEQGRLFDPTNSDSWRRFISDIEVFGYSCEHESMLTEPNLSLATEEIQNCLDRVLVPVAQS